MKPLTLLAAILFLAACSSPTAPECPPGTYRALPGGRCYAPTVYHAACQSPTAPATCVPVRQHPECLKPTP
jgi:hypothetical protein